MKRSILLVLAASLGLAGLSQAVAASDKEGTLEAARVPGSGPILDPQALLWENAKAVRVALQPQNVTTPSVTATAVNDITVRSVHNGQWLALLLEWQDTTRDDRIVVDHFGDQVAVEFPVQYNPAALPSPMMGSAGERVNILQWRASFQADLERGHDLQTRDLYPNAMTDLYPDQVLKVLDVRPYTGAVGVDNPVAKHRDSPVLDQMAEGFGSLTVKAYQFADGKGVWKDGVWHVVITAPMADEGSSAPRLYPGSSSVVAFAVWDGGHKEVGSRKAWSDWVPITFVK
ncbi:MAG: hypothetical protein HQL58_09105 [Magnetococcales bacterium]|nr:hypothetical protein [Magnetococcales bacterium]